MTKRFLIGVLALLVPAALSIAGPCVSQRQFEEQEAARRALEDERRRQQAYQSLREQFWIQAMEMEKKLTARKAKVLVDTELVTHAAINATVKTMDLLWQRWTHEDPGKDAGKAWDNTLKENMSQWLKQYGMLGSSEDLDALVAENAPAFAAIAEKWQKEFAVSENLQAQAVKVREENALAMQRAGVRIEAAAEEARSATQETTVSARKEAKAKKEKTAEGSEGK